MSYMTNPKTASRASSALKTYDSLIRVSKMGDRLVSAETTMTITDQASANARAISDAGGKLGKELRALDQSGWSVHKSEAWQLALSRIRAGKSHGIVVAYGDRLTRNWRKVGAFYDALEEAGAEVIIAGMPGVDYRTPEGRTMTGLMAVMSDAQYMAAKARGDRIADATIARGVTNRVPFGYRRNANADGVKTDPTRDVKALVPHPVTAEHVRTIFTLRADGWSWANIADELAERGITSPRGLHWTTSTLSHIVKSRTYLGVVTLGDREVEAAHEPLVSSVLWRRAQSSRTVSRNGRLVGGLSSGLLFCSACDHVLSVVGSTDHLGNSRPIYGCRRSTSSGKCSRPVYVGKRRIDEWLDDEVAALFDDAHVAVLASARDLSAARAAVERASAELDAYVENASALDAERFKRGLAQRQDALDSAQRRYDELVDRSSADDDMPTSADAWRALDLEHQRRVVRLLIDRIVVSPPVSRSKFAPLEPRLSLVWR